MGDQKTGQSEQWRQRFSEEVMRSGVELQATMPLARMTLGQVAGLRVGQVVEFEGDAQSQAKLSARQKTLFVCEFGKLGRIHGPRQASLRCRAGHDGRAGRQQQAAVGNWRTPMTQAALNQGASQEQLNRAIEELRDVLHEEEQQRPRVQPDALTASVNSSLILDIPVEVQIVLGSTEMPVSELMGLQKGSTVALNRRVGEPVDVVVNGRRIARARSPSSKTIPRASASG